MLWKQTMLHSSLSTEVNKLKMKTSDLPEDYVLIFALQNHWMICEFSQSLLRYIAFRYRNYIAMSYSFTFCDSLSPLKKCHLEKFTLCFHFLFISQIARDNDCIKKKHSLSGQISLFYEFCFIVAKTMELKNKLYAFWVFW